MGLVRRGRPPGTADTVDLDRYNAACTAADRIRRRIEAGGSPVAHEVPATITLVPDEHQALGPVPVDVARCDPGDDVPLPPGALWPLSPGETLLTHDSPGTAEDWAVWEQRWRPLGPAVVVVTSHRLVWVDARRRQENLWWPQLARAWVGPTLRHLVVRAGGTLWRLRGDEVAPVAIIALWAHTAAGAGVAQAAPATVAPPPPPPPA